MVKVIHKDILGQELHIGDYVVAHRHLRQRPPLAHLNIGTITNATKKQVRVDFFYKIAGSLNYKYLNPLDVVKFTKGE